MISKFQEEQLWERALAFLERGRPRDVDHTRSVVAYGKILLAKEGGNPLVVTPSLILHDIGWSRVDFSDFINATAEDKINTESVHLHMQYGAEIASEILNDLRWDQELIQHITRIISIHDIPEKVQALDDLDATLVFEADWLDKYAPGRQERYFQAAQAQEGLDEIRQLLATHTSSWFRTRTALDLLGLIRAE